MKTFSALPQFPPSVATAYIPLPVEPSEERAFAHRSGPRAETTPKPQPAPQPTPSYPSLPLETDTRDGKIKP